MKVENDYFHWYVALGKVLSRSWYTRLIYLLYLIYVLQALASMSIQPIANFDKLDPERVAALVRAGREWDECAAAGSVPHACKELETQTWLKKIQCVTFLVLSLFCTFGECFWIFLRFKNKIRVRFLHKLCVIIFHSSLCPCYLKKIKKKTFVGPSQRFICC